MGKKKNNSSKSKREMDIHHDRFVTFMKYLKDHDAEVKLKSKDPRTGETYSDMYSFRNEHIPFVDLLSEALNISYATAYDYMSRSRSLKTTYKAKNDGSNLYGTILAIEYYFLDDGPVHHQSVFDGVHYPYAIRLSKKEDLKRRRSLLGKHEYECRPEKVITNLNNTFLTRPIRKYFLEELAKFTIDNNRMGLAKFSDVGKEFPYNDVAEQIEVLYDMLGILNKGLKERDEYIALCSYINKLIDHYKTLSNELPDPLFMPGYIDFHIPYILDVDEKEPLGFRKRTNRGKSAIELGNAFILGEKKFETGKLIKYRYDILDNIVNSKIDIESLPIELHALFLVVSAENIAIRKGINHIAHELIEDCRFVLLASNSGDQVEIQEHDLSIHELSNLLSNYYLQGGLRACFDVNGSQILMQKIYKYPEPEAVKKKISAEQIKSDIKSKIVNDIINKYLIGLNIK